MEWLCSVGIAVNPAPQPASADNLFGNHPLMPEARDTFTTELLKKVTADEKIGQLRLISVGPSNPKEAIREVIKGGQVGTILNTVTRQDTHAVQGQVMELSRLRIPLFFAYDMLHGQRTVFSIGLGLASSPNLNAVKTVGRVSAYEAADDGLNMARAPVAGASRDPRWGCASEGFGEDTYLTSIVGKTTVQAVQDKDPADRYSVMTNVEHPAAYDVIEGGKEYNTVGMNPRHLFNDYMPPYKAGPNTDSGAAMVALNSPNGMPATSDPWLLENVLRDQWDFKGITVSDHGAIKELVKHGTAADPEDVVHVALRSEINVNMSDGRYSKYLLGLVRSGKVMVEEPGGATRHILNVKYDMGLFNDPYGHLEPKEPDPVDTSAEGHLHRKETREVARESLVLLKNRPGTLPLKKFATTTVVGPLADSKHDVVGSWSAAGVVGQSVTVLIEIRNVIGGDGKMLYARGANVTSDKDTIDFLNQYEKTVKIDPRSPQEMIDKAVQTAKRSDVVVAAVGEVQGMAREASSRADTTIPQSQRDLIATLKATSKPLVLVLMNGRPLALVKEDQQTDATLETWFAGVEGGNAIVNALFGDYNPSGKLSMSFPCSVRQIPVYYSHLNIRRPYNADKPNKYTSRYFDEANGMLYSSGYSLSYATLTVSDVKLSTPTMKRDGKVTASMQVTNTGKREGVVVIQIYLQDVVAPTSCPVEQLKGFKKITLKPGETQTVSFPIGIEALRFRNQQMKYGAEPGKFSVLIGIDSVRVKKAEFELL